MKYETTPTIIGTNLSVLLEMSLSVPNFLAHPRIIARGSTVAKIIDIASRMRNLLMSPSASISDMIKNSGMQMMGGLLIVEIMFAIFINYDFI